MRHQDPSQQKNRISFFAGKFYPGTTQALNSQLKQLFDRAKKPERSASPPRSIISPHAGYVFSGEVAASAFNQIPEGHSYNKIFIIGSSHRFHFNGAAVFSSGNYETPLGEVVVDTDLAEDLTHTEDLFMLYSEAHEYEHSLEVQLPFLQYKLPHDFSIVPIVMGTHDPAECKRIAQALEPYFTPDNLFVISTDFSHYPGYEDAVQNDRRTANAICSNDPEQLLRVIRQNSQKKINHLATSLCGWTSVLTLLYLTQNKNLEFKKIKYQNSGDQAPYGDKERVVGYWALAVFDKEMPLQLTEKEQKELLKKARNAISQFVCTGKREKPEPPRSPGILQQHLGVFVSIYINNELRGCIGNFAKNNPLNDLAQQMAVSAACDYRFDGIKQEELDHMSIEISVLSPLKRVRSIDEIKPGIHGIYIKKNHHSGTFLPQVAQKTGWNTEELLSRCARDKAGLGPEGWKDAEIYTYEAFVFRG
jgi:MEMO1 family protein